jgi:hypothetical protein
MLASRVAALAMGTSSPATLRTLRPATPLSAARATISAPQPIVKVPSSTTSSRRERHNDFSSGSISNGLSCEKSTISAKISRSKSRLSATLRTSSKLYP